MDMDGRWLLRSPQIMFETFHGFSEEGFHLIIEDLLGMPDDKPILARASSCYPVSFRPS